MYRHGEEKCANCGHRRDHHHEDSRCYFILKDEQGRDTKHCSCKKFIPSGDV